jgi:hypothetical protein
MRQLKKDLWPYKVAVNVDDTTMTIDEIEIWLGSTYGVFRDRWNAVYQHNRTDYYFRQGTDATMFALRWGA